MRKIISKILLVIISTISIVYNNPTSYIPKDSTKRITTFSINNQAVTAKINDSTHLVKLKVPYGTSISSISPSIVFIGASINPSIGSIIDFTEPVIYTVTAEDSSKQNYTVIVKVALNSSKMITSFCFSHPDINANINDSSKTITITVPSGQQITSLSPTIVHTGKSITPESGTQQNFTNPVTYTITAEDGTKQYYTITVQKKAIASKLNFLILGNSITHHTPLASIGWSGDWGMAASCKENDYVHVLMAKIANCFVATTINYKEQNIAGWEQDFYTDLNTYSSIVEYVPDVLIIRLGENVNEDYAKANNYYLGLLKMIKHYCGPYTKVIVTGNFWPSAYKDSIQASVAKDNGWEYVDLKTVAANRKNYADGLYPDLGVASHPSDAGMNEIAILIYNRVFKVFFK